MRFITEFELCTPNGPEDRAYARHIIINQKTNRQIEMGEMLADSFGWQNPVNNNPLHHRLEIEAFRMDKWVEFKSNLFAFLELDSLQYKTLLVRISELESFGKPVV